jgi:hypothetical protein
MTLFFDIETNVRLGHDTSTETADNLKTTERERPQGERASGVIFDISPDAFSTRRRCADIRRLKRNFQKSQKASRSCWRVISKRPD